MIKKTMAAVVSSVVLAGGLTGGLAVPAHAASGTQKICSSKNSKVDFFLYIGSSSTPYIMDTLDCQYHVPKGGSVVRMKGGSSYRVGYGGDYSECRTNSGFTPYTKADSVYFKTYIGTKC